MRGAFAAGAVLLLLGAPAAGQGTRPASRGPDPVARFNAMARRLPDHPVFGDDVPPERIAALWNALDAVVLAELNAGRAVAGVDSVLSTLRGYDGPHAGDGVQIGGTVFYRTLPRDAPSYVVAAACAGGEELVVGVFNSGVNRPGRVSVYARRGGRWVRTGRYRPEYMVEAHLLRLTDSSDALVTLDAFLGADRQEGHLRAWSLDGGVPRLLYRRAGRLLDYDVDSASDPTAVRIEYTEPMYEEMGIGGVRAAYELTLRADAGRVRTTVRPLTPWVEVLPRYFAALAAGGRARARAFVRTAALMDSLGEGAMVLGDSGDLGAGRGAVIIAHARGAETLRWRVESERTAAGRWLITRVVFLDRRRDD